MTVEELCRLVRLGSDVSALAQLEHRFERCRRVAPRAGDDEAVVLDRRERLRIELAEDLRTEIAHVLALKCAPRGTVAA